MRHMVQPHLLQGFRHTRPGSRLVNTGQIEGKPDIVMNTRPWHERRFLKDKG